MKAILLPRVQKALDDFHIPHKVFACDPKLADTITFCETYGFKLEQSANTIIVTSRTEPAQYAACVVLPTTKLDVNKKICQLLGVKRASFAPMEAALKLSGMEYGGVTVCGLPKTVPIYIDKRVLECDEVVMGGGLDSESIAANIGLSVLMVFSPDKGTAKGALKKVIEKSLAKNKVVRGETGEPEAWVNQTYDLLDCIVNTEHDSIDQPLKREGFEAAADLAHGCLGGVLDTLDLQGALAEVLSSLKSIPAVIEGMVYSTGGALLDTLPEAFDQIKQKQPSITVVREGNTTPAKPKPKPKPSKKPQAQPSNKGNLGALVGEWKAGSGLGLTTLYLKSSGPSTYKHFGPCSTDPDSTKFTWCTVTGTLTLTAYDAKYVDARWGEPTARDRSGNRITLIPEVVDRFSGTSVISLAPDGRAIAVDNGLYSGIEFCSPQMYTMSRDTNSTHWSRCNGVPK